MLSWKNRITSEGLLFTIFLMAIGIASAAQLVTMPRIFFDEATTIEIAHNYQLFGVLDILTAPGQYSGVPYLTGSSGYPVTVPLATVFKVFGFGFAQARIYALVWLLASLVVVWFFVRYFWNASYATAAVALMSGFASLYDSGRRVMGDVPGFALLLLGLLFLFKKDRRFISGIFFGLAVATKPSVYLLVIPALIITYVISDWRRSLRNLLPIGIGALIPVLVWIILQFPQPLHVSTWQHVIAFYQNAFGSSYSPWITIVRNIKSFLSQTTLMYFALLAIPTVMALKTKLEKKDLLMIFIFLYGILDLIYFLKSPGIIRYLLPLELFILILLPGTIAFIIQALQRFGKFPSRYLWYAAIGSLSALHLIQFMYFSSVVAKNTAHLQTLKFLDRFQTEMIGVISTPHIAAFIPPDRKLHYVRETDQIIFGTNPLDLPKNKLPGVLVIPAGYEESTPFSASESGQLKLYSLVLDGKWKIYTLNR